MSWNTKYEIAKRKILTNQETVAKTKNMCKKLDHSGNINGPQGNVVAIGAPVQLVKNTWPIAGLLNGATSVIDDIIGPTDNPEAIIVRINGFSGNIPIKKQFLVPKGKGKPGQSTTCFRQQFGINLCFANSIHKSQGATDKLLGDRKQFVPRSPAE